MIKPMSLAITYRNSYIRTNDKDGSTYRVYCYLVDKNNNKLSVETLCEDTKASGYDVLTDEETQQIVFRTTRVIPPNCNIMRTSKGKWVADTAQLDMMDQLAKRYPHLYGGVGQAIANQLLGKQPKQQTEQPENKPQDGNIDPFS